MNRIQKVSKVIWYGSAALALCLVSLLVLAWSKSDALWAQKVINIFYREKVGVDGCSLVEAANGSSSQRLLGLLAMMFSWVAPFLILLRLRCLSGLYKQGVIFSLSVTRIYRHISVLLLLDGLAFRPLSHALMSAALTLNNAVGERVIAVGVSTDNVVSLCFAGLAVLIAWVMHEGQQLLEEQQLTV